MSGRVERIWLKRAKRGNMDEIREVRVEVGKGIVGNVDQGGWRQITIITQERWEELMRELGVSLDPSSRRANLLLSGVDLAHTGGCVLEVGNARLRVRGETRPCQLMEQTAPGLRGAMTRGWGGGAFAEVLTDGSIAVGNTARWVDEGSATCKP